MSGRQGRSPVSAAAAATPAVTRAPAGRSALGLALRLPVFVATSGLLGVAAHTVATGMLPSARAVGVALVAATALGALHRRREARFESLTALLLVTQALLHVVLCLDGALPRAILPGGAHGVALLTGLYPGHPMFLAHVLAAGVAGWWLTQGEAAAWAAARRVWHAVRPAAPTPSAVVVAPRIPAAAAPAPLRDEVRALRTRPRRGPPVLAPVF